MIEINVDLNKSIKSFNNRLTLRQGDIGEKILISISNNREPIENLQNLVVKFEGNNKNGDYVEGKANQYNNVFRKYIYQFKSEDVSVVGNYQRAFIRVYDENGNRKSSEEISIEVLKNADISKEQAKIYVSKLDGLIDELDEDFDEFIREKEGEYQFLDKKSNELDNEIGELKKDSTAIRNTQTEILQSIEDNELATINDLEVAKQESSANVVDQIGGTESAILKKELIVDGNEGTASRDSNGVQEPFSQADYDDLNNPEKFVRSETLASERGAEIEFDFSVIETLERKYPYIFEGLTTNAEKFEKMHELLSSLYLTVDARGGGIRSSTGILGSYTRCYSKTRYGVVEAAGDIFVNTSTSFKNMSSDMSEYANRYYQYHTGSMIFFVVSKKNNNNDPGAISDGITPAFVEVKDIRLIVELEVNGRTIIEEMIAANHAQNLATQAEAEAGTDNKKSMTPLGTAQQIDKRAVTIAGNQTVGGIKNFKDGIMIDSVTVFGITRSVIYDDAGIGGYFNASDKFTLGAAGKIDKIVLIW
ncbi:BppU family phage baseplate upper protein, partial [Enterococcus devriesei]|uniref:BppU family phage baseplate upper protein n=2 Tax=Enterococcus devriesei TaxID=319970 RepID=UPI0035ED0A0B